MAPRVGLISQLLLAAASANAYFLFAMNDVLVTERADPIVSPNAVAGHAHSIYGASNFGLSVSTSSLRQSQCTSSPIKEDNSVYWTPTLYFQWKNGSFTSVGGSPVIYYLFSDTPGVTTPFPDDFRMITGTPTLRTYNASSFAQQAVTFLCLDFSGTSTKFNELPAQGCPSGIRAQINFPSCWDGVNKDSADHKSHVAFLSTGPDSGTCDDTKYPKTLPRIFMEMYLDTAGFWDIRDQAMNASQPFVYSMGDPTGYGYHAGKSILFYFYNGWGQGVLQKVVDGCNCNPFGDPTCCSNAGIFNFVHGGTCQITPVVDEQVLGTLDFLPGNNPVVREGGTAENLPATTTPLFLDPVRVYTTEPAPPAGTPVSVLGTNTAAPTSAPTATTKAASSMNKASSSTNKAAPSTNKAASSTSKAASSTATGARPPSGSGSPAAGSFGNGSGSPATGSSSTGSGSGSGSSPPVTGSGASSPAAGSDPAKGSPATGSSGTGSGSPATGSSSNGSGSGSGSTTGSGSSPAKGSPAKGSGSKPAKGSSSSSSGSGSNVKTCDRKGSKRSPRTARKLYDAHAARRRRFAAPSEHFLDQL
ncbi:hypothetical protein GGX14DRAFT_586503 [Mycena pura]|uniref:DUF1996 domain-containing protein n=1 Tax=Mycena pura TaxID=153505 RepID=A0AAD6YGH9_9AGAR|nr:hypothetical protein GGX14DRAFT_586503 [Mycena pura]